MKFFLLTTALLCMLYQPVMANEFNKVSAGRQMIGAEITSLHSTGYGLYVVRMKPSQVSGVISSFFLFSSAPLWPKSWSEIDLEFTPGYATKGEKSNRFVLNGDQGACFDDESRYGESFFRNACPLQHVLSDEVSIQDSLNDFGQLINRALAFNTFGNTPLVFNQSRANTPTPIVQTPGNHQVFYLPENGLNPYEGFYNYYIWYTPGGVFWSGPSTDQRYRFPNPNESPNKQSVPMPIFAKLWNSNQGGEQGQERPLDWFGPPKNKSNRQQAQILGMAYHKEQLTPINRTTGRILPFGRPMRMAMNIWDGFFTEPVSNKQPWGGWQQVNRSAVSSYQKLAYFPLKDPNKLALQFPDPHDYEYSTAYIYSDFTKPEGEFFLNGQQVSFNQIWEIQDGAAAPLGFRSGYHVLCYPKYLSHQKEYSQLSNALHLALRPVKDELTPRDGAVQMQNNTHTNCRWADQRGL